MISPVSCSTSATVAGERSLRATARSVGWLTHVTRIAKQHLCFERKDQPERCGRRNAQRERNRYEEVRLAAVATLSGLEVTGAHHDRR